MIGCQAISRGCDHCYAEAMDNRWGRDFTVRRRTSLDNWKQPVKWNKDAKQKGVRYRVFCASLSDVFDAKWEPSWRLELFSLIRQTPHLDWQLLTKRPEFILASMEQALGIAARHQAEYIRSDTDFVETRLWLSKWLGGQPPANVWLGASVEDRAAAEQRLSKLMAVPARIHFVSAEPLLEQVWLFGDNGEGLLRGPGVVVKEGMTQSTVSEPAEGYDYSYPGIDWVIIGGESGAGARPCDIAWIESLSEQCALVEVPCFVKQLGTVPVMDERRWLSSNPKRLLSGTASNRRRALPGTVPLKFADPKGGDVAEFPAQLQVRQFPEAA